MFSFSVIFGAILPGPCGFFAAVLKQVSSVLLHHQFPLLLEMFMSFRQASARHPEGAGPDVVF